MQMLRLACQAVGYITALFLVGHNNCMLTDRLLDTVGSQASLQSKRSVTSRIVILYILFTYDETLQLLRKLDLTPKVFSSVF